MCRCPFVAWVLPGELKWQTWTQFWNAGDSTFVVFKLALLCRPATLDLHKSSSARLQLLELLLNFCLRYSNELVVWYALLSMNADSCSTKVLLAGWIWQSSSRICFQVPPFLEQPSQLRTCTWWAVFATLEVSASIPFKWRACLQTLLFTTALSYGHYTAYSHHPVNRKWHYFNDESVSEVCVSFEMLYHLNYCWSAAGLPFSERQRRHLHSVL